MKSKILIFSTVVAWAGFLPQSKADIDLGTAGSFAVLGGTTVVNTGSSVLNGNLGVSPGSSIVGFPPGTVNGTVHDADAAAAQAQNDATTAYNNLAAQTPTENLTGQDLGNQTLTYGVYFFSSSAQLTGTLILSGTGDFIFQIGSTLTTASAASMILENGAQATNVYWQVGSSATLNTGTSFDGSILANTSITMDTGTSLTGRALALNGAVTLDDNNITVPAGIPVVPEPSTLISGALLLLPFASSKLRRVLRRNKTA